MIYLSFVCMFAVREISFYNHDATNIEQKSETKKTGRRTVESTAVFSGHRFEVSRSDLPPLFNHQNLFIMREKKDEMAVSQPTDVCEACEAIKQIFIDDNLEQIKHRLWIMFSHTLTSIDSEDWTSIERSNHAFFYKKLEQCLIAIKKL